MKTLIKIIIVAAFVFFGISLIGKYSPTTTTYASTPTTSNHNELLAQVRKEPRIIEAIVTDANVLYVSVLDDGTRRDGYAAYLCEVLSDFNTDVDHVKVVKYNSHNDADRDNAYGILLGEYWCK
jgi:hypothetical protein